MATAKFPWIQSFKNLFYSYKRNAKKRNIEFQLTIYEFAVLTKMKCYLCDALPSTRHIKEKNYEPYFYNGIDRVDSSLGYVPDNVRPCCKKCNYMKNQMELKEFHEQVRKIHNVTKNKSGSN